MLRLRTDIPRVAIFLMNAYITHNDMLRGILDYTRTHTPWALDLKTGRRDEANLRKFNWSICDAAIVNGVTPELLQNIHRARLPVVLVSSQAVPSFPGCVLYCDNRPIAEAAARHLLSKMCAAYAFVDVPGMTWAQARERFFAAALERAGATCLRLCTSNRKSFARQLAAAPKPLGVFAADDVRARETLDVCRVIGSTVPDDVAILGVDNDETLCELSDPTLSSIPLSTRAAGYQAADILDRALHGELAPKNMPDAIYTGDTVIERRSTDRSFARDALIRRCRDLLATNFTSPLRVPDLARALHVSRRTLETHFREVTGTSVNAEILRLRLERAKCLLATTKQSQEKIALSCGFCDASHLGALFRKHVGRPPSTFRTV